MPVPAKLLHVAALLGRVESTYGTAASLTASSDGIQMQFESPNQGATFEIKYANDGSIGQSMQSLGQLQRVAPAARYAEGTIPAYMRLPATAYSATVLPGLHPLVLAAGFDAAVSTAGSTSVSYTPTAAGTGYTSLTLQAYERGESQVLTGALCDLTVDGKDGKPPRWAFSTKAIAALPADASPVVPTTIDFRNKAVMPVPNVGITVSFGSYVAPIIKSWSFALNRTLDPRINYTGSNAHAGFVPAGRRPELKLVLEATALQTTPFHNSSGFDPYSLLDVGTAITAGASVLVGSSNTNKYTIGLNQAQVTDVKRMGEGSTATFEVTLTGYNSTALANDDCYITCA